MSDLPPGFELDAHEGATTLPSGFELDDAPKAEPHKFGIMDTWPARLAKGIYSAVTLPGDVYSPWTGESKIDPLSQEAIERAADIAMIFNPAEPGLAAGRGALGAVKTVTPKPLPANVEAAQTALDVGGGLPRGVASANPIVRGLTQGAAQLPLVGPKIRAPVGQTVEAAGDRVGEIASELKGGAAGRADVGQGARSGLQDMIESNNAAMDAEYNGVRQSIDPDKQFKLPSTDAALKNVLKARSKMPNPGAGLDTVSALVKRPPTPEMGPTVLRGVEGLADTAAEQPWGASFNELQRARSEFNRKTAFGEPNPGYSEGERKFLSGAMKQDMENIARQQGGEEAVAKLQQAGTNAKGYIEQNQALKKLVNKTSDEGLAGVLIGATNAKTGNIALLRQIRAGMPPERFQAIGGQALSELGHNPATGEFSLNQFMTGWNKLDDQAKSVIFEPAHKQALDSIANLGKFIKGGEQYKGHSNTGHAVGVFAILEHFGEALGHAATGNFVPAGQAAAGVAAGYTLGNILAKPVGASAVARWTRAAQLYEQRPSIRNRVAVNLATRNLITNLESLGVPRDRLIQALGPQASEANSNQPPPPPGIPRIDIPAQPNR